MNELLISDDLIFINLNIKNKEEGISILGQRLLERGLVEQGFVQRLIEREKNFPTGLPTSIPIALCHTEAQYVNQSALAMATLKEPVIFQEMGTPEHELAVELILVLALKDPKDQVPMLRKIVTMFKDQETLAKVRNSVSSKELGNILSRLILDENSQGGSSGKKNA